MKLWRLLPIPFKIVIISFWLYILAGMCAFVAADMWIELQARATDLGDTKVFIRDAGDVFDSALWIMWLFLQWLVYSVWASTRPKGYFADQYRELRHASNEIPD